MAALVRAANGPAPLPSPGGAASGASGSGNPLGTEPISRLVYRFGAPSILAMIVAAFYNIVDQIFIGQGVGMLGNAATNVALPFTTVALALTLMIAVGGSSNFNLQQGAGHGREAAAHLGNAISLLLVTAVVLTVLLLIFMDPMLRLCGATDEVMPYARTYVTIIVCGFPLFMCANAFTNFIRADGSPRYSMICNITGAGINIVLNPTFIFALHMGIAGSALATVIGEGVATAMALVRLLHFRTAQLQRSDFRLNGHSVLGIVKLGSSPCINQLSMLIVQVVLNNLLVYYGSFSVYGSEIPLAAVGIVMKINMLFMAFVIGLAQGCQPIMGFNYGAHKYERVRHTYRLTIIIVTVAFSVAFILFQVFPRQIISIFGEGNELYFEFSERCMRIFLGLVFLDGIQPVASQFFSAIGKAPKGAFLALTRQLLFMVPVLLLFSSLWGIDGVLYSGPTADALAAAVSIVFIVREMRTIKRMEAQEVADAAKA